MFLAKNDELPVYKKRRKIAHSLPLETYLEMALLLRRFLTFQNV